MCFRLLWILLLVFLLSISFASLERRWSSRRFSYATLLRLHPVICPALDAPSRRLGHRLGTQTSCVTGGVFSQERIHRSVLIRIRDSTTRSSCRLQSNWTAFRDSLAFAGSLRCTAHCSTCVAQVAEAWWPASSPPSSILSPAVSLGVPNLMLATNSKGCAVAGLNNISTRADDSRTTCLSVPRELLSLGWH